MVRRLLVSALLVLLTGGCTASVQGRPVAGPLPEVPTTECAYTSGEDGDKVVARPSGSAVPAGGQVVVRLGSALGDLELTLEAAYAPCSVHSFRHLVDQRFYRGSSCHRLVTDGIWIIQCGDPTTSGVGGPGYRFDDPDARTGGYKRGVVGMANKGTPGTNGSQFFIVYKDSDFPAYFPVIGKVTKGLDVVDRVAAGGITPTNSATDGTPLKELRFTEAEVK
ncbi:peptidylprolyl isomerase [Actinosynnema sp. NPDC050436]|uniref:peptidylprolyl isomerase n=1 Tax=Actinosynnema sp. NPDC050436 TaxID=3155659 RepID=UPI00340F2157